MEALIRMLLRKFWKDADTSPRTRSYVKNFDAARTFEFILTCPTGVSATMVLDGFSAKARFAPSN